MWEKRATAKAMPAKRMASRQEQSSIISLGEVGVTFDRPSARALNAVDQYHGHGQEFEDEIARQNGLVLVEHASIEIVQGLLAEFLNLPADGRETEG